MDKQVLKYAIMLAPLCFALLTACKSTLYSVSAPVNPGGWNTGEEKSVIFCNSDTVSFRELALFLAYDGVAGRGEELEVEVAVTTPDSLIFTEIIPLRLAADGQGLKISGRIYRAKAILTKAGEYKFSFRHGSAGTVRGVRAVGIELTDMQNGKR